MAALTDVKLKLRDTEEIQRVEAQIQKDEVKQEELHDLRAEFVEEGVIAVLQNRANNTSERIARSRTRLDHLEKEKTALEFRASLQSPQSRGPDADVANQPGASNKRAASDELAKLTAKRFCAYQGPSRMTPAERIYESLPSDETRKAVKELMETDDQVARYARQVDRSQILVDHRWIRAQTRQEHKTTLDDVVGLLTNRGVKSISHVPSQMDSLIGKECRATNAQHVVDMLLKCVRNLQLDSTVIGQQIRAIADGVKPTDGTNNLLMALQSTHSGRDMQQIYEVQVPEEEGQNGSVRGSEEVWRGVCSADSASHKSMLLRLLRSALVLSKYTCLATCLTLAVAPKSGGSVDGIEALKNSTVLSLVQHHRSLLNAFHEFCDANWGSVAADMHRCAARYDPDDKVRDTLRKDFIFKRVNDLSRIDGIHIFWYEFLVSNETEMTF
ncbi:uncharacterized protein PG986_006412 [Apiospora aurea]|uniref:Uncharacterized protein n=1 Tax=Apiospora aurea TaxID=335848 RepID=A0ABR1QKK5_9PEZI